MSKQPSLWRYLGTRLVAISLVLVSLVIVVQIYLASLLEAQNERERIENSVEQYAQSVNQYLLALLQQIEAISNNSIVVNALVDFSGREDYLPLYLDTVGIFGRTDIAVQLVDFQNEIIEANFYGDTLSFASEDLWLDEVLTDGNRKLIWSAEGLYIAMPVLNRNLPEGAILIFFEKSILVEGLSSISSGFGHHIETLTGELIYSSDPNGNVTNRVDFSSENIIASPVFGLDDLNIAIQLYGYKPNFSLASNSFVPFVLASLLLMVLCFWLVLSVTIRQLKDLMSNLTGAIAAVNDSQDLSARVDSSNTPKELAYLSQQFNSMVAKLEETTTSRDETNSIIQSMGESVFVCDNDFNVLISNKVTLNPDILETIHSFIEAPFAHGIFSSNTSSAQFEDTQGDQTVLWQKFPLIVGHEKKGWVYTGSDISAIRSAQRQMKMLEMAIDSSSNGMIVVDANDPNEPIIFANQSFLDITGFATEEILGRRCDFLQGEETSLEARTQISKALIEKTPITVEILNYKKSGEPFWNQLSIDPVVDENNTVTHFLGVIRDITALVQSREELQQAKDRAEAAASAKSDFLATMSHEIRTPMNGVIGMLNLLLGTDLDEDQLHRAKVAQSSAQSLLVLINDILDFSKIEAGKLDLESVRFDLRSMLGDFAEAMAHQAQSKGIEIILDVTGVDVQEVIGDPGRIRQVMTNLVGNAIKFTREGEILIQVSIDSVGGECRLIGRVNDSGIGIPPDKIDQLFSAFSQVDASTTRQFGGTGLGLAIVKRLCELMGGDIRVSSEVGRGSLFEFEIAIETLSDSKKVTPPVDIRGRNILIVDANQTTIDVLRGQLSHWQANVYEAQSVDQGLELLRVLSSSDGSPEIDMLFIALQFPTEDRSKLLMSVKNYPQARPIKTVGMSTMNFLPSVDDKTQQDFDAIFPKPLTTSDIMGALAVLGGGVSEEDKSANPYISSGLIKSKLATKSNVDWPENSRILIVDDSQINLTVASGILETFGLHPEFAGDGQEAIELLKSAPWDAPYTFVFMDCQMPVMDGFSATKSIRAGAAGDRYSKTPIVAMTANAMEGDRDRCLAAGMDDYISKPVDASVIKEKLVNWLIPSETEVKDESSTRDESSESTSLNVWDMASVLERLGGNETMINTLIKMYIDDKGQRLSDMVQASNDGDFKTVSSLAHTIKGIAANLSAEATQHAAAAVEQAVKDNDSENLPQLIAQLIEADKRLILAFEQQLNAAERLTS